ncbi:exosortase family protein XrtF [Aequorivita sp. SDUM287046]|uniref:Exosortase family protein XrtF n=1 Tax=Aequorivita aurantiaca TaxID=3053356 RepID=A0ABT8DGJ4_9FLAO|nr:exosortase family protein XrtF [Aequorivita aurantiaca]MDN3724500.1 exosortase family protein XrtF [Aequorivita aurantiaca]
MRKLFLKYKSVIRFIFLFLGTYLLLGILYSIYLKLSETGSYFPDLITNLVAKQSAALLDNFGYNSILYKDSLSEGMLLTIDKKYTVNIVEGCNAVSVIILFIAFIIAFAEKFKKTFLFLFAGSVIIYAVNILRIAILTVALYKFPQYESMLHSVVFPGIIYSMVFILWMVWVWMLKPKSHQ